jgi:hypothetical protein
VCYSFQKALILNNSSQCPIAKRLENKIISDLAEIRRRKAEILGPRGLWIFCLL